MRGRAIKVVWGEGFDQGVGVLGGLAGMLKRRGGGFSMRSRNGKPRRGGVLIDNWRYYFKSLSAKWYISPVRSVGNAESWRLQGRMFKPGSLLFFDDFVGFTGHIFH